MTDPRRQGIVLTNGTPMDGMMFHMALLFDQPIRYPRQFQMIPVENHTVKLKHRPTERNANRVVTVYEELPLIFGDTISWDRFDEHGRPTELVREYKKVFQAYPARLYDGESQLLLQGIMSKNRKCLWMCDMWPDLEIPYRIQKDSHPNVTVNAWVTVHIKPNQTLKYELHSFKEPADQFQCLVPKAEWNDGDDGHLATLNDPVAGRKEDGDLMPTLSDVVTGMHGIVISEKIVMAAEPRHQDYCFHRIVINEEDRFPRVGSYVRFNAEKLDFLNIYALKEVIQLNDGRQLPLTENGLAQVTIRQVPELPGFFHSKALGCYVDDPENILEAWLLSTYSKSTLQVGITATEPSPRGNPRFVVGEIIDKRRRRLSNSGGMEELNWKWNPELSLILAGGFILSAAERLRYPPGTRLFINALLRDTKWILESVEVDQKEPYHRAVVVRDEVLKQDTIWLNEKKARGCKELPFLLSTLNFGLVQTPKDFKVRKHPDHFEFSDIWITMNDSHPGDFIKPPAKFKFSGIGNIDRISKPIEPVYVESTGSDYPDLSSDLDESISRETALNDVNVPRVYQAITDEEFRENFDKYWQNVRKMVKELERNPRWQSNPLPLIEGQIKEHLAKCRFCSENEFNENCFFGEYLAEVIQRNPSVQQVLTNNILSVVTTRRYRQ
uniref:Lignostilbene-alpha,beta-dioxygenase isozyme III n=1 Tax=Caenorhabditis tropicalis TaxID=1561998 RepID=A0A1I7UWY6_9PELO